MVIHRPHVRPVVLLLVLLLVPTAISCGVIGGKPSTSAPGGFDDPDELLWACGERHQEIIEWAEREERRIADDFIDGEITLLRGAVEYERVEQETDTMRSDLSDNCEAEADKLRAAVNRFDESRSRVSRPLPTATPARVKRVAAAPRPTSTPRPTRMQVPTLTSAPTPTPVPNLTPTPTLTPVPSWVPLVAAFMEVPASHNSKDPIVFRLRFTEPVSTSYKTLRDIAIQVENGSVRESKRVDKRSDLWMVAVEPEGDEDVVIMLTASADCDDAAGVCTGSGKTLSNSPVARVPYGG